MEFKEKIETEHGCWDSCQAEIEMAMSETDKNEADSIWNDWNRLELLEDRREYNVEDIMDSVRCSPIVAVYLWIRCRLEMG